MYCYRQQRGGVNIAMVCCQQGFSICIVKVHLTLYCICIETRGGIYSEIQPEPKGNPKGEAPGISRGLRLYFTVYPDSSHNTDILNHNSCIVLLGRAILKELILRIVLAAGALFSSILPALLGVYWKIQPRLYWEQIYSTLPVELDQYLKILPS